MESSQPSSLPHVNVPPVACRDRDHRGPEEQTRGSICISVVIPTYKRPALLRRCLLALCAQTMNPRRFEIIVVDDAPTDDTKKTVACIAAAVPWPAISYIAAVGPRGPAAARNRGWRAARADLIAFTDDDCVPLRNWLSEGWNIFRMPGISGAWGDIIVPLGVSPTDHERNTKGL
ncbi:MAG: hypothetical protein K0S45_2495, partial [Nitrospira sp.]|nr:hypothetical protein [Nitrospira sp.]